MAKTWATTKAIVSNYNDPDLVAIKWFPEASGQTFKEGDFVYLASGLVTVAVATTVTLLGIAMRDASGTANTSIPVQMFTPTGFVTMNVLGASAADKVFAASLVGAEYDLQVVSAGIWAVDSGTSSYDTVQVVQLIDDGAVGDTNARCLCRIASNKLQLQTTT